MRGLPGSSCPIRIKQTESFINVVLAWSTGITHTINLFHTSKNFDCNSWAGGGVFSDIIHLSLRWLKSKQRNSRHTKSPFAVRPVRRVDQQTCDTVRLTQWIPADMFTCFCLMEKTASHSLTIKISRAQRGRALSNKYDNKSVSFVWKDDDMLLIYRISDVNNSHVLVLQQSACFMWPVLVLL